MSFSESPPEKIGAGLLVCCDGACLLLKRSEASGNPGTWGLPGGNADGADAGDLLATALREAGEEIGHLPPGLKVVGSVRTRRGKNLQKHYTVFLAQVPSAERSSYAPALNEEHTDWRWVDLRHVSALAHPHPHGAEPHDLLPAAHSRHRPHGNGDALPPEEEGAVEAAGPPPPDMQLHPVLRVLFGGAHAEALGALLPRAGA